jgi:hypothetical protein
MPPKLLPDYWLTRPLVKRCCVRVCEFNPLANNDLQAQKPPSERKPPAFAVF